MTVDIALTDGKITDYAQDVKACALGQAAAAVIGQSIIGRTMAEVQTARDELNAMLNRMGQSPLPRFRILRFCCLQKISKTVTPQSCSALMRRLRPLPSWITRTRKAIKHIPQKISAAHGDTWRRISKRLLQSEKGLGDPERHEVGQNQGQWHATNA